LTGTYELNGGTTIPKLVSARGCSRRATSATTRSRLRWRPVTGTSTRRGRTTTRHPWDGPCGTRDPREEIFITSKVPAESKSYDAAVEQFGITMSEIGLDYLDLLLIHAPWPWDQRGKDCREGTRGLAGDGGVPRQRSREGRRVSNFTRADLESLLPACTTVPAVDQIQWYIGLDVADTVAACAEHGSSWRRTRPSHTAASSTTRTSSTWGRRYEVTAPQLSLRYLLQKAPCRCPRRPPATTSWPTPRSTSRFSDADMATLDAMHDTESHPLAANFRGPETC